ncbi:MAG: patatin-like phospholipase family protein [Deltaproteobacteria bacterium]|nr:patatin-like phospholipase family protein [Deltaproteobacteria bacterium]
MAFSRMVAFDGGPASLTYVRTLRDIVGHHPNLLLRSELFAGTSGGALTAAFLARRIEPGLTAEGAHRLMRELVDVNNEMLALLAPNDTGYERLLLGDGAMVEFGGMHRFLARDDVLGASTRLSDLKQPVALVAARSTSPWKPHVQTNFGPSAEPDTLVIDAVLRSAAFPMLLPGWQGHVDGAMYANNPATIALAYAKEAFGVTDDVMILSMGADDGSCLLSNLTTPHDVFDADESPPGSVGTIYRAAAAAADRKGARGLLGRAEALAGAAVRTTADLLLPGGEDELPHLGHILARGVRREAISRVIEAFDSTEPTLRQAAQKIARASKDATALEALVGQHIATRRGALPGRGGQRVEHADNWGWQAWLAYVGNPMFALQVLLNSQGRGACEVIRRLLSPDRVLRVAPVVVVPSNVMLLAMILGLGTEAKEAAELAAELWGDPEANEILEFETSLAEVQAFADRWNGQPTDTDDDPGGPTLR